ncbi:MAG: ATP-binding protein [Candidatus Brocadiae bacterium]|nr:ATP-binding protein [Candidatus Brocadiia bacterium]
MTKPASRPREDRLRENLKLLRLAKIAEVFPESVKLAAQANTSHLEFLEHLIGQEAAYRHERMIKYRIGAARLPFRKTIADYDFSWPTKINKQKVLELAELGFIERKANAVFIGPTGVGKTHLANAIAFAACEANISVRFTTTMKMVNHLTAALADGSFARKIKSYTRPKLLVLDELGYMPIDRKGADIIFQVASSRYEQGSILLTTNRPFRQWGSIMNQDNTLASALIDRLGHHAEVVLVEGKSFRMKGKEKEEDVDDKK